MQAQGKSLEQRANSEGPSIPVPASVLVFGG